MTIIVVILVSMSLVLSYLINDYFWGSRKRELVADGTEVAKVIASMKNENPRIINTYLRYFRQSHIRLQNYIDH